jgi:hypothetical protein
MSTDSPASTAPPPSGDVVNPCTAANILAGNFFFVYPADNTKYIECTVFPGVAVVKACAAHHYWSQTDLICLYNQLVISPTDGQYSELDNPCSRGDNAQQFYPYPAEANKFIRCDEFGQSFVVPCANPIEHWVQSLLACIPPAGIYMATIPPWNGTAFIG